jgi:predicted RNA binding protein YcfA (HicA-like mRNA interferase family)
MKLVAFMKHLRRNGCEFAREGANHSVWRNKTNGRQSPVPRHRELPDRLVKEICVQLGVEQPKKT